MNFCANNGEIIESTIAATIEVGQQCHTDRIIAGRFGTKAQADIIAQQILLYVADHDVSISHNNPPGQHGLSVFGHEAEITSTVFWPGRIIKTPTINVNHARAIATQKDNGETAGLAQKFGVQGAAAVASFVIGATAGPIVALEGAFGCVDDAMATMTIQHMAQQNVRGRYSGRAHSAPSQ